MELLGIIKFDALGWLFNSFVLMFVAVFTGMLFGKIKFGKFNFGVSGTLFTGLIIGWWVYGKGKFIVENQDAASNAAKAASKMIKAQVVSKDFFILFLVIFVAAVGLLAAKDMGAVLKKYGLKFVIMGFLITLMGAAATYGMTKFSPGANPYEVSGVYTGALTSSPGLAAAIETAKGHATHKVEEFDTMTDKEKDKFFNILGDKKLNKENTKQLTPEIKEAFIKKAEAGIGVGHAIGYPFGVLIVIIVVNFFPKIFGMNVDEEYKRFQAEMNEARGMSGGKEIEEVNFDLTAFAVACFLGYTIGKVKIYLGPVLGDFSLGSTGGVLIGSLILGYIGKIGILNFRMNNKILGVIRQLALAFFLAIVGLRYGFSVFDSLFGSGAYLALVALVVGVVAMSVGFAIGRYVFKINWIMLSGAICGGMTSTPGLGAAIEAVGNDDPAAGYGATYPFALLGMVIFTIVLHNLPM